MRIQDAFERRCPAKNAEVLLDQGVQAGLLLVIFGHIAIGWHSRADDGLLGLHSREGPNSCEG